MTPIRTIIHGAVVTIHSDFVSVSVTRFVPENCYGAFDRVSCDGAKRRATLSKSKFLSQIDSIDAFVDSVIQDFKSIAQEGG